MADGKPPCGQQNATVDTDLTTIVAIVAAIVALGSLLKSVITNWTAFKNWLEDEADKTPQFGAGPLSAPKQPARRSPA